jgi:hypothetical protein
MLCTGGVAALALLATATCVQAKGEWVRLYNGSSPGGSSYGSEAGNRNFFTKTAQPSKRKAPAEPPSLKGWHVKDGKTEAWKANGEMISCVLPGGGWLASDKQYGDFELKIDYRIGPGGNSGLGIRFPTVGDPAHEGIEIQILDDNAPEYKGKLVDAQYTGGLYYQVAAKSHPAKAPGQWNHYDVYCKGDIVRVKLNGVLIQDCDVSKETNGKGGHKSLAARPRKGHIGMQSHGHQVDFRNIEIREL